MDKTLFSSIGNSGNADSSASSSSSSAEQIKRLFEVALKGVREEFDDHRESINDSANEIEANYELLCKLESRVDRIEEQLQQLQLMVSGASSAFGAQPQSNRSPRIDLDEKEKEVFLVMYTAADDKPLTYREIASALKESEFLIRGYITNIIEKGVPVTKRYINDTAYLSLDTSFKDRQAKENIVRLSQKTVSEFVA